MKWQIHHRHKHLRHPSCIFPNRSHSQVFYTVLMFYIYHDAKCKNGLMTMDKQMTKLPWHRDPPSAAALCKMGNDCT